MKKEEKRHPRSYKARKTPYVKAARRAKREGTSLSEILEVVVMSYADPTCGIAIRKNNVYTGIKTILSDKQNEKTENNGK